MVAPQPAAGGERSRDVAGGAVGQLPPVVVERPDLEEVGVAVEDVVGQLPTVLLGAVPSSSADSSSRSGLTFRQTHPLPVGEGVRCHHNLVAEAGRSVTGGVEYHEFAAGPRLR